MCNPLQVRDGDVVCVDAGQRRIDLVGMSDQELVSRKGDWSPPPLKANSGALLKYIKLVAPASQGCVTDIA